MSEFDFDELDRAVNTVLSGGGASGGAMGNAMGDATGDAKANDTTVTSLAAATPVIVPAPAPPSPITPAAAPEPLSSPAVTPAVRRSTGRFMDMVHPSSDMRATAPAPSAAVSRTAPALSSIASSQVAPVPAVSAASAGASPFSDALLAPVDFDEPRSLESPFLPDAKVEKRPLGGAAAPGDELSFTDMPSLSQALEDTLAEVSTIESEDRAPAIETAETTETTETAEATAPSIFDQIDSETLLEAPALDPRLDAPSPDPLLTQPEPQERLEDGQAPDGEARADGRGDIPATAPEVTSDTFANEMFEQSFAPTPVVPEAPLSGPASITQQYTEKPSTTAEPGAIFDTESYHRPLTPVAKKKSGLMMFVWMIVVVLAGAGVGTAVYVYVLPLL